jgi:hypothetical protein
VIGLQAEKGVAELPGLAWPDDAPLDSPPAGPLSASGPVTAWAALVVSPRARAAAVDSVAILELTRWRGGSCWGGGVGDDGEGRGQDGAAPLPPPPSQTLSQLLPRHSSLPSPFLPSPPPHPLSRGAPGAGTAGQGQAAVSRDARAPVSSSISGGATHSAAVSRVRVLALSRGACWGRFSRIH